MNRLFTLTFVCIFTASVFISPVKAQEENKVEQINELLELMQMDSMVESLYSQMQNMLARNRTQLDIKDTPQELELWQNYVTKSTELVKSEMTWTKMKPEFVKVYSEHFTQQEIEDLLVFYRTPTGQKLIQKMPLINQQSMRAGQVIAQKIRPQILTLSQELATNLQSLRQAQIEQPN